MMRFRFLPILLILFSTSLNAQTAEQILKTSDFPAGQRDAVLAEFKKAAALGIPDSFLIPRLEEGMAKNVPAARIIGVISREREAFAQALGLLEETGYTEAGGSTPPVAEWQRTAYLLLSGVDSNDTGEMLTAFGDRKNDFRQGSNLYIALVQWGIEPEEALHLAAAEAASPLEADSFMGIPEILIEARRQRIRTGDVTERIADELPRTRSLDTLRDRVLY